MSSVQQYINHQMRYLKLFIHSPRTFGTVVPSSSWLCNRMVGLADWRSAGVVAELGAGDGVLTRYLLKHLASEAELDAWEIQPDLIYRLRQLAEQDSRLLVVDRPAEQLDRHYDLIFSCLPLLSVSLKQRHNMLRQIEKRLNPGGVLIQFQYTRLSEKNLSRYFNWTRFYEARNFPPAWIYVCTPARVQKMRA